MLAFLRQDSLPFAPAASKATPDASGYGPEWDADANTPQDNGGNNPWAPGYDHGVWG